MHMQRMRCSVHGLILFDDGSCSRCRTEVERRKAWSTYLAIGGIALVVLSALSAWRVVTTARAELAQHEPATPPVVATAPTTSPVSTGIAPTTTAVGNDREARVAAAMRDVPIVIYTADYCGWCRKTKTWLDGRGIAYTERRVDVDAAAKRDLLRKFGEGGIPALDIEGELHQGYSPAWIERTLRARAEWRVGPG